MLISEMIEELQNAQSICGDVPIIFAKDDEGNSFLSPEKGSRSDYTNCVIFWPSIEGKYPEDVLENNEE